MGASKIITQIDHRCPYILFMLSNKKINKLDELANRFD